MYGHGQIGGREGFGFGTNVTLPDSNTGEIEILQVQPKAFKIAECIG